MVEINTNVLTLTRIIDSIKLLVDKDPQIKKKQNKAYSYVVSKGHT